MWVFDATPLIYLAKVERLQMLGHLDRDCVVPGLVYSEVVVTGVEEGYADARRVEQAVDRELLATQQVKVTETIRKLRSNDRLSAADAAVLGLAYTENGTAVMDERYGRDVAEVEGINHRGTAYIVLRLAKNGSITADEARETVDAMVDAGWYCAPDLYAAIVGKIDELDS